MSYLYYPCKTSQSLMRHVKPINMSVSPSQSHAGIGLLGVGISCLPPSKKNKKHCSGNYGLAGSQPVNQPGFSCDTFDPVFITAKTPSRLSTHTLFLSCTGTHIVRVLCVSGQEDIPSVMQRLWGYFQDLWRV